MKPDDFSFSLKPTHDFSAPTFDVIKEDRAKGDFEFTFGAAWKRNIDDILVSSHLKLEEPSNFHSDRFHMGYNHGNLSLGGNSKVNGWDVSGSHNIINFGGMYEGT